MSGAKGSPNGILSRDAFFAACKSHMVTAVSLEDGGMVNIRKLTLGQLKKFDDATDNFVRAKMLILDSVVDGNHEPIFQSLEEVDTLDMALFKALSEAVTTINALNVTEATLKNSETAKTPVLN